MVESLKELNQICQKPNYREVGNWMVRKILRPAALPVTWLLLHTPVSANQVTLIALAVGLLGAALLALPSAAAFFWAAVLLQLWYLLDHVDGQIARYRKTACLSGRFFDFLMHHLVHASLPAALAWFCYGQSRNVFFLFWGYLTVFSMFLFNLIQDAKCKTFVEKLLSAEAGPLIQEEGNPPAESSPQTEPSKKKIFTLLHKLLEMHVMMNLLTLAAFFEIFTPLKAPWRFYFFLFYGILTPVFTALKTAHWIQARKIDQEFAQFFPNNLSGRVEK